MDLAPLAPRPENFPRPDPIPCPIRWFLCFWPLGGFSWLRFISLIYNLQEMRDLLHHAPKGRRIGTFHNAVHLLEPQRPNNNFVLFRRTDYATDQLDLDHPRHKIIPPSRLQGRGARRLPFYRAIAQARR